MYQIRLHGRGGQGIVTGSRILGSALFAEGFEVQDAPRYGAERRGAPLFATVRADRRRIQERGLIRDPDVVAVGDDTLVGVPAAGVLPIGNPSAILLLLSDEPAEVWKQRLRLPNPVLCLPAADAEPRLVGARLAGAVARLLGVVRREALERGVAAELAPLGDGAARSGAHAALEAFDAMAPHAGAAPERRSDADAELASPDWIDVPLDPARIAAPSIYAPASSVQVRTGLWRTFRPVIDHTRCHRCTWVCGTLCPDGAIVVDAQGFPQVDLDHCKGCLVCVAVCPTHAIHAVPEREAARTPLHVEEAGA